MQPLGLWLRHCSEPLQALVQGGTHCRQPTTAPATRQPACPACCTPEGLAGASHPAPTPSCQQPITSPPHLGPPPTTPQSHESFWLRGLEM